MSGPDTTADRKSTGRKPNSASLANLRKGGGRPKGVPNKASVSLKELAREYTPQALETLAQIMVAGESEAARVSAANAILDRGYGKPSQVLAGDEDGGAIKAVHEIILRGVMPQ
jgi:hypothetical protein